MVQTCCWCCSPSSVAVCVCSAFVVLAHEQDEGSAPQAAEEPRRILQVPEEERTCLFPPARFDHVSALFSVRFSVLLLLIFTSDRTFPTFKVEIKPSIPEILRILPAF